MLLPRDNTTWTDNLASFLPHPNQLPPHTCQFAHSCVAAALRLVSLWDRACFCMAVCGVL